MRRRPRLRTAAVLGASIVVLVVGSVLVAGAFQPNRPGSAGSAGPRGISTEASTPPATRRPSPGHEVYGYVPYWEMDQGIAAHLAGTDLTTLALFSVTSRSNGSLDVSQLGYRRIAGPIGRRLIREAHARGVRVELVFTSFGTTRNKRLFGAANAVEIQDKVIASLVDLAASLQVDGINVDVESLDARFVPAYGDFVGRLRGALTAESGKAQVSVATTANITGAAMAMVATRAGADRIFMMGYDYHWSGSAPGASAPIDRRDGDRRDLVWSLDLYEALGVPVERTLLGLPLYGMAWPVAGPELGARQTGRGRSWIPSDHLDVLGDPSLAATRDPIEQVELYAIPSGPRPKPTTGASAGTGSPPGPGVRSGTSPAASIGARTSPGASPSPASSAVPGAAPNRWLAIYVDSPATLTPKLGLANDRGLAGVGFWAIGYERGLPEYTTLISQFRAGELK